MLFTSESPIVPRAGASTTERTQRRPSGRNFQSFPSGHTTTAIALAFVVGFLWPRLFPYFLAIGVVVGISRVPVGMHYPTDVFAGLVVGMLGAYLVRNIFARRGVLFEQRADGHIVRRPLVAIRSALQRARA